MNENDTKWSGRTKHVDLTLKLLLLLLNSNNAKLKTNIFTKILYSNFKHHYYFMGLKIAIIGRDM